MKHKNYKIIESPRKGDLERMVEDHMSEGWRLQGGVCVFVDDGVCVYAQAMVKP